MDLSRRGFFKGVAALFAGAVAAQLPSCSTGGMTPAVAAVPTPPKVTRATLRTIRSDLNKNVVGWLHPGRINKYKGEILAHAVPQEMLTATKIKRRNAQADGYVVRRMLPYSTDPLIEGLTPLPENLLEPGPRVG